MRKKFFALLLAAAMAALPIAGCASPDSSPIATGAVPTDPIATGAVPVSGRTEGSWKALAPFISASTRQLLSSEPGKNRVYSPANLISALGMLAEITDGNSRRQILALLGQDSIAALEEQIGRMWSTGQRDDERGKTHLASSLWLDQKIPFRQETIDKLAKLHYASAYQGEMGDEKFDRELQNWINENTGDLLQEQSGNLKFDRDTVLALATTIHYQARWQGEFSPTNTVEETFYSGGKEERCLFMHRMDTTTFYRGEDFTAGALHLRDGSTMWFFLPEQSSSVEELLAGNMLERFFAGEAFAEAKRARVSFAVPKFDVASDMELTKALKALGITDVFDDNADFSPITEEIPLIVSQVNHAARLKIDEEGCEAAAYTVIFEAGCAPPKEEEPEELILDRPFLFVVTGANELPLFTGVVNHP